MTPPPPYLVLDASLWIDVLLTEGYYRHTAQLLADAPTALLIGPPHLRAEVTHALHGRTRRTSNFPLTPEEAQRALTEFLRLQLMTLEPFGIYQDAFTFARTHQVGSLYDTLYVVLAQGLGADFWTADQRLVTRVAGVAPWVRFIATYPL